MKLGSLTLNDPIVVVLLLCLAALIGGAINSVAGGGTLLTFPALVRALKDAGESAGVFANGTSTFALMPGSLAGSYAYRKEIYACRKLIFRLIAPSILGGALGSLMVTRFPPSVFKAVVPWLILLAAFLFLIQGPIKRWTGSGAHGPPGTVAVIGVIVSQFFIAVYGGYFGAGIGILMLSVLPFMGTKSIHETNAAKTVLASLINAVTVVVFVIEGVVVWKYALIMALAAIVGGYLAAHYARRMPALYVRLLVIAIGFGLGAYYLWEEFGKPS